MGRVENDGVVAVAAARIGANANLADGEEIVLGNKTYQWNDTEGDVPSPKVWLDRTVGTDALAATELMDKINDNKPTEGGPISAYIDPVDPKTVRIEGDGLGSRGNIPFTTTMADPLNVIAASDDDTLSHGADAENKHERKGSYIVTAIDVLAGSIAIPTNLQAPTCKQVDCWSATGLQKNLTTLFTFDSEGRLLGEFDGGTNPAEGDEISWSAW